MKYFISIIIVVVAVSVISGFFIIGSPTEERARRFDERRVQDLQIIQSEIINYWRMKNRLPESLDALRDDLRGFSAPEDPETSALYEYAVKGGLTFELCAVFNKKSTQDIFISKSHSTPARPYGFDMNIWEHSAGRVCFDRIIDKELYPSKNYYKN